MHSNIRYLLIFSFLNCFRPHWPIAIIYFHAVTGSFTAAMAVYSVAFFTQAICEVPAGSYSDKAGRRRTMMAGAVCASLSIFLYACGTSEYVLYCGGIFEGIARAFFSGTDTALLYESIPTDRRESQFKRYLGRIGSMYQLGLCLSAALCAVLSLYSVHLVVWVSVIPQLGSVWTTIRLIDVSEVHQRKDGITFLCSIKEALRLFFSNSKLRLLAIADTIDFGFGEALFYFQGAFFGAIVSPSIIGVTRCLNHFTGFIGFWCAATWIQRLGAKQTLMMATVSSTVIKLVAVIFPTTATPFLMAGSNITYGPSSTARGDLLQGEFSEEQRATMGSLVSLAGSLLFSCISLLLGVLADRIGLSLAMVLGITGSASALLLYRRLWMRHNLIS
jgi:MFS family permease